VHKRLLNWEKSRDNVVVHFNDEVKTSSPSSVGINLIEEAISTVRDRDVQDLEILDFTKVSDKDWVKVDADESLLSELSLLAHEKPLVELFFGVFFNSTLPFVNLGSVELIQVLAERVEEFHDILVLFTVLEGL